MSRRSTFPAALVLLVLAPFAAAAQQPVQVPATLTLEEALRIARGNSPAYLRIRNDADPAAAQIRQSWAAFLPTLNTNMNFSGGSSTTNIGQGDFGDVVTKPEPVTIKSSSASQGAGLSFQLFDGGAMFNRLSAARAGEEAAFASMRVLTATADAKVENDFYLARQADMLVDFERQNLQKARDNYERSQEQFRMASIKQHEMLEAQRAVLLAEKSLRQRETEASKSRLTLAETMGLDPGTSFTVAEETPEVFDATTIDADALVAVAAEQSPTVMRQRAQLEQARKNAAVAKGSWFPTVSASLNYSRSGSESGYGAFGDLNPNRNRGYGFGMQFSFPIFDRFSRNTQITQATVARYDAEQDLRTERLRVSQQVRAGLLDLVRAYADFQTAEQIAAISQRQVDLADEQFRLGGLSFLDYQRIFDQNVQAQRDAVLARFAFNQSRVTLEQTLGAPISR